ncbi:hypothetical protein EYC84_005593 [Monilinia fructicola]|uniref:Uncharacterized protein n=1 Tax=Monilinia fructicola TaxID=38448 RepID=A0A5M9JZI0_MONFR|nr:hypothetical protein EYC84_005593 [Monilinia fructicola]
MILSSLLFKISFPADELDASSFFSRRSLPVVSSPIMFTYKSDPINDTPILLYYLFSCLSGSSPRRSWPTRGGTSSENAFSESSN